MSNNPIAEDYTTVKAFRPLDEDSGIAILNQHEVTNLYRRLALEVGKPATPEQHTTAEWLAEYDAAGVFS